MGGQKVMDLLLTTNEKPYKFTLFLPAILKKVIQKDEYQMTIDHNPGTSLEIATNGKRFTGFKIAKTGNGNEREVIVNGKKLAQRETSKWTSPGRPPSLIGTSQLQRI